MKNKSEFFRILKYVACAASAGVIELVSFTILSAVIPESGNKINFIQEFDISVFVATTVALVLSIIWNFTLNRKFTFKDAGNLPKAMLLAFVFYIPFWPFKLWVVQALKDALEGVGVSDFWASLAGEAVSMIANLILEFLWQRFVVFRKSVSAQNQIQSEDEQSTAEEIQATEEVFEEGCIYIEEAEQNDQAVV